MTDEEKKQSIETDPKLTQLLESAGKSGKIIFKKMVK